MHFALRAKPSGLFLDLAPLIDMVFLLLIFLMIGSRFLRPVLDLELPEADAQAQADRSSIVLSIDRKGAVYLDGKQSPLDKLAKDTQLWITKKNKSDVIIQADRNTPFHLFVKVLEKIRKGGASALYLESRAVRK